MDIKKRGNLTELVLSPMFVVLIVLGLVFFPLLKYATSVGQSSFFEREFYAKDLGLMISAFQAAPNNVIVNYERVRNVNVSFTPNYIESFAYNIDPSKNPSKVTKFHIFPSSIDILKIMVGPSVVTDDKGNSNPIEYNIVLNKNDKSISIASSNGFSNTIIPSRQGLDAVIDSFVSHIYEKKSIYIDTIHGSGILNDNTSADIFGRVICNGIGGRNDYLKSSPDCDIAGRIDLQKKIKFAKNADFVVLIFVNDNLISDDLKIYYYEGSSEFSDKSNKIASYATTLFENKNYVIRRRNLDELKNSEVSLILDKSRSGFVIEIGKIDTKGKDDISKISDVLSKLLSEVSK